jgi:hypothetical protein
MASLELQSIRLIWVNSVEMTNGNGILEAITCRANDCWGERWIAEIVKAYVKVAIANGDEKATPVNRRPQTKRALKAGSCTLDTAI